MSPLQFTFTPVRAVGSQLKCTTAQLDGTHKRLLNGSLTMGALVKTTTKTRGRSEAGYMAALIGALCIPTSLSAASVADQMPMEVSTIHYLPATNETHVTARLDPALCVALSLPQQWRREGAEDGSLRLAASGGAGEIEVGWRAVRDLAGLPQGNAGSKDAELLQRDHEGLLGRKANASTVQTLGDATRWTATWIDTSLPAPSHSLTVETYIVPASREWLLELSISDINDRSLYEDLVRQVLSNVRTASSAQCGKTS